MIMMKIGVIDVGGGLRGIYATGIFDYCIDNNLTFDYAIGISAGSANVASFMAQQKGRNYRFFATYSTRKNYMSFSNILHEHCFMDLDYIYSTLSNSDGEDPLDYEKLIANPMEAYVACTNAITGQSKYFNMHNLKKDDYDIFKASCCIPVVCKTQFIDHIPYFDGALGNSVPIQKAFDDGCDKVVLILTKPLTTIRKATKDIKLAKLIEKDYPNAAEALKNRAKVYNDGVSLAKEYAKDNKVLIIAPDSLDGVSTLKRDPKALDDFYHKGYKDAVILKEFLK